MQLLQSRALPLGYPALITPCKLMIPPDLASFPFTHLEIDVSVAAVRRLQS
jgi:hypothetical protein